MSFVSYVFIQPIRSHDVPNLTLLTHREIEVLNLIAAGKRNSQIATTLHITVHTVETHLRNIYGKLDICTRTEAARWYWEHAYLHSISRDCSTGMHTHTS